MARTALGLVIMLAASPVLVHGQDRPADAAAERQEAQDALREVIVRGYGSARSLETQDALRDVVVHGPAQSLEAQGALREVIVYGYGTPQPIVGQSPADALVALTRQLAAASRNDPVSYVISGRLADSPTGGSLPLEVLATLRGDNHLRSMNVSDGRLAQVAPVAGAQNGLDRRASFSAAFGFATVEEFHDWYAEQGANLHRAIERAAAEDVRFNLSVVPAAGSQSVPDQP